MNNESAAMMQRCHLECAALLPLFSLSRTNAAARKNKRRKAPHSKCGKQSI
jgi:hypothetical protein